MWATVAASAQPGFARADLQVNEKLRLVSLDLQKAGEILEQWSLGRLTQEATQKQLQALHQLTQKHRDSLSALKLPGPWQAYQQSALQACSARLKVLEESAHLVDTSR